MVKCEGRSGMSRTITIQTNGPKSGDAFLRTKWVSKGMLIGFLFVLYTEP